MDLQLNVGDGCHRRTFGTAALAASADARTEFLRATLCIVDNVVDDDDDDEKRWVCVGVKLKASSRFKRKFKAPPQMGEHFLGEFPSIFGQQQCRRWRTSFEVSERLQFLFLRF